MKKILALALAAAMSLSLVACGGGSSSAGGSDEKVIKIGVFEPTTGENGGGGQLEVDGIKYANQV